MQTVSLSALFSDSSTSRDGDVLISVCPIRALRIYIDRSASFRQSISFSFATVAVRRTGRIKTEIFPLDCGRHHGCLYEPRLEMPFHITQQGLSPPPEHGREVCLFSIYALQAAGLLRITSSNFIGCTFSPWPLKCCG